MQNAQNTVGAASAAVVRFQFVRAGHKPCTREITVLPEWGAWGIEVLRNLIDEAWVWQDCEGRKAYLAVTGVIPWTLISHSAVTVRNVVEQITLGVPDVPVAPATESYGRGPKYVVNRIITREEACAIQTESGYHPAGYGFYGFKVVGTTTTWTRGNTCD